MTLHSPAGIAIEQLLGRPATASEFAVYAAQQAKLGAGVFDNPLTLVSGLVSGPVSAMSLGKETPTPLRHTPEKVEI